MICISVLPVGHADQEVIITEYVLSASRQSKAAWHPMCGVSGLQGKAVAATTGGHRRDARSIVPAALLPLRWRRF